MGKRRIWSTPMFTTPANYGADRQRVFSELHDALIAVGLTQTSDTGQLVSFDSTGVTATANTNYGFRIYKIHDELSIESPVYLKISFKVHFSNPSSTHFPDLEFSVGSGTDGSGNLQNSTPVRTTGYGPVMCYTFTNTVFSNENMPSFVYSGGGITWVALKCGFGTGNNTAGPLSRADIGGIKSRHTWISFFVARPLDETGALLPGYALGVPSCIFSTPSSYIYMVNQYNFVIDSVTLNGVVARSSSPSFRVMPDALAIVDGKPVVAAAAGKFANKYYPLAGVASIPAIMVNAMDTIDIAIAGIEPRNLINPHPGLYGLNRLDDRRHNTLATFGSPEIDTLVLAWDGVDV